MLGSLRSRHWKPRGKEALDGAVATSSPSRRWMAVPPGPDVMRHLAVASRDATTSGLAFEPTSDRPVPESERERRRGSDSAGFSCEWKRANEGLAFGSFFIRVSSRRSSSGSGLLESSDRTEFESYFVIASLKYRYPNDMRCAILAATLTCKHEEEAQRHPLLLQTTWGLWIQENSFCGHYPVVVDLLQCLVADGALEDHTLKRVGFVAGHQLHTHHLTFSDGHITENLPEHEALIKHRRTRASANQLAVYGEKGLKATSDPVLPGISFCGYGCLQPPSAYRRRRCSRYVNRNRCNIISAVTASQDSSLCQQAPSLRHRRSRYVNRNCCIVTGTVSASTGVVVASHEPSLRHRCVCVPLQLARFQQAVPLVRYGLQHVLQGPDRFGGILALTRESCHDARGCHPTIPPLITGRCSSRAEYNKRAALPSAAKRRAPGTPHAQP
ncbi:hypothetical protein DNTS_006118, partial [Danionella cerebrum]